ncbi:hypothetical protein [Flavobacterium limi]|uniref:Lipoprotein n=1 Tax=Flavobacterium limi TaxID=2045105 RepID=A0ABQ1TWJ5_9FLAO|nr:hypothetical protein [Flavobacterium limi]GGF03369.1 hypothetical protein GCM10011518_10620 [Flavobacterium limi]
MKSSFNLIACFICLLFLECDTIYKNKSNSLSIKADSSISNYIRIEGVLSIFPDIKKIYINSKNRTSLKDQILIIIFSDEKDLFAFKQKIDQETNKSIENIKTKIDTTKENYALVYPSKTTPHILSLTNVTVFKNGLWLVFYSETNQDIETVLEFKRIGISVIPQTHIIST